MPRSVGSTLVAVLFVSIPTAAHATQQPSLQTVAVAGGVHMLQGAGGNIGVSVGPDGAFLVDDQVAPVTPQIIAAVAALTDQPVRFVINTHWHPDHTGGNEAMGSAGALIVAHEHVRRRLSVEQFITALEMRAAPLPERARPVVTFTERVTFHWNGEEIDVVHVETAHTDGDAIVHFRSANVIHAGDVFFNALYPLIDASSGGTLPGTIAAVDTILARANPETAIIPGHGRLGTVSDLRAYRDMLATLGGRVQTLVAAGRARAEVIAAKPSQDFDAVWGGGFLKPDQFVGILYDLVASGRASGT